jgi:acetyl esterase/lipase
MTKFRKIVLALSAMSSACAGSVFGAPPTGPMEKPAFTDVAYGPDPKQKLDIYLPQGSGPFPVLLYIHGGGWYEGDKVHDAGEPAAFLKAGAAFVSINYRLVPDAVAQNITPPITAVLGDNRRALQFIRLHAADYHLDPEKIVVGGGSAGALSALYLGCEGEQANPNAADPVERMSTRVIGVAIGSAQTSIDPRRIREWNPSVSWGYWAFEPDGKKHDSKADFERWLAHRERWLPLIQKYSPEFLITKDTPPIYMVFGQPPPAPDAKTMPLGMVHSALWGIGFQKVAQAHGVECYLQYPGHPAGKYDGITHFVLHQLGLGRAEGLFPCYFPS